MTLRSTARDAYHVALDFWGCLRRFADGKAVNGYDDHVAGVLAEAAETERCARETGPTSTPEKHGPGSRPSGPILQRESIAAGATLSNEADERQQIRDALVRTGAYLGESLSLMTRLTSAAPGTASPAAAAESPGVSPPTRAPGHPNWCAAEMHQLADILARCDEPFALGYANDLRHAAMEASGDPGQPRVLWPWSHEDERQK